MHQNARNPAKIVHILTHGNTYMCAHAHASSGVQTYVHTCVCAFVCACTHTYMRAYMRAREDVPVHVCMYAHACVRLCQQCE